MVNCYHRFLHKVVLHQFPLLDETTRLQLDAIPLAFPQYYAILAVFVAASETTDGVLNKKAVKFLLETVELHSMEI